MPGTVIGVSMNMGYPGSYARNPDDVVMSRVVSVGAIVPGGLVVIGANNSFAPFGAANTMAQFAGVACKEVKNTTNFATQAEPTFAVGDIVDVLERGNIVVQVTRGTPVAGGPVYVRTVLGAPPDAGAVVGGIEAAVVADGGTSILLTNCEWATGTMDANGRCELCIKNRNRA